MSMVRFGPNSLGRMKVTPHATRRIVHGASRWMMTSLVPRKSSVLLPDFVEMRALWSRESGVQNNENTPPPPRPLTFQPTQIPSKKKRRLTVAALDDDEGALGEGSGAGDGEEEEAEKEQKEKEGKRRQQLAERWSKLEEDSVSVFSGVEPRPLPLSIFHGLQTTPNGLGVMVPDSALIEMKRKVVPHFDDVQGQETKIVQIRAVP